jgi:hypothetical protein
MAQLSNARKLGILARIATQRAERNRTIGAALKAVRITGGHFGHVLSLLWLEVTGFVFLAIGVIAGSACYREYVHYRSGQIGMSRTILAGVIALMFAWFGISSFWRVRRKRK